MKIGHLRAKMVPIELSVRYSSGREWHSDLPWEKVTVMLMKVRILKVRVMKVMLIVRSVCWRGLQLEMAKGDELGIVY